MEERRKKTIAALEKQVDLLSKDGVSSEDRKFENESILALSALLHELHSYQNTIVPELRAQLAASQRMEQAAEEDLELNAACPCRVCKNAQCYRRNGRENCKFDYRGPQEDGQYSKS